MKLLITLLCLSMSLNVFAESEENYWKNSDTEANTFFLTLSYVITVTPSEKGEAKVKVNNLYCTKGGDGEGLAYDCVLKHGAEPFVTEAIFGGRIAETMYNFLSVKGVTEIYQESSVMSVELSGLNCSTTIDGTPENTECDGYIEKIQY